MSSNKTYYHKDTQRSQRKWGKVGSGLKKGRKQGFALSLSLRTMLSLLLCGPPVPHPSCLPDFSESQSLIHSARTQSPNDSSCPKFTRLFSTHAQHQPEISFWFLVPIPQKGTHYLRRTFCPSPQKPLIVLWPAHTQATPGYHVNTWSNRLWQEKQGPWALPTWPGHGRAEESLKWSLGQQRDP